jgi:murein L,D-transpeptidase YafK
MSRVATHLRTALVVLFLLAASIGTLLYFSESASTVADNFLIRIRGLYTIDDRVAMYKDIVAERLESKFLAAGVRYPPSEITFIAFKDTRRLEVYARNTLDQPWKYVRAYPIRGASGVPGPKLASGDEQVPEGIYRAESLNPNSRYHLAIRVNYPNDFDRRMAERDQRANLGGDIMIHGSIFSVGCLAMGDDTAEDLFVLAALAKPKNVTILITPTDLRHSPGEFTLAKPPWSNELYAELRTELRNYR